jgi:crossover junction endodeoxyribonuclease RusA
MQEKLILKLPFPPTVNHVWKHACVKGKLRSYMTERGKAYRHECIILIKQQHRRSDPLTGRLHVTVEFHVPGDKRRRDIDNLAKATLDAITAAGVWTDDEQIDILRLERKPPTTKANACAIVVIKTIPEITDA